jgi:hypothetical protein
MTLVFGVPVVALPELVNLIPSTLVPSTPAVTMENIVVPIVPLPSEAVFVALILTGVKLPFKVNIGVVFAAIIV